MRVSDYIKTDSSDNMSKKAAVVGSSNSVDMSDTIYASTAFILSVSVTMTSYPSSFAAL